MNTIKQLSLVSVIAATSLTALAAKPFQINQDVAEGTAMPVTNAPKVEGIRWIDARTLPVVLGTVAPDAKQPFSRLPDSLESRVRPEVWALGLNSAGIAIRFSSDATDLRARWRSHNKFAMNHMTPTGIRGLDLYTLDSLGNWTTVGPARPVLNDSVTTARIVFGLERKPREYMLYMPLYDGVDSLWLGIDSVATVGLPTVNSPRRERPIVMYGTSLLQGGCASRPGTCHTNILERRLDREVYNLGFSGNAKLDPEIAEVMASIDAGLYVLDMLPNCTPKELEERVDTFFTIIRTARPEVPVLLIESPLFPVTRYNADSRRVIQDKNRVLSEFRDKLLARGEKRIYYIKGEDLIGDEWECTVDNYHFTDLGFRRLADVIEPVIRQIYDDCE